MHHHHQQLTHRSKTPVILLGVGLLVVFLFVLNIVLSAEVSHLGIELKELEIQKTKLIQTNQSIEHRIIAYTALKDLEVKAQELGFVPVEHYLDLNQNTPIAYKHN